MNITRNDFLRRYSSGLDANATTLPKSDQPSDRNGDGLVKGDELGTLYQQLTTSPNTLLRLDQSVADKRQRVVAIARGFAQDERLSVGYKPSQKMLSTNRMHNGRLRADGLVQTRYENVFKCNLFVGDVLEAAGLPAPKTRNPQAGWVHFAYAETWRDHPDFQVVQREHIQPGDILAIDYPDESGAGGGHLEVVTEIDGDVRSMGARYANDALVEDNKKGRMLADGVLRPDGGYFDAKHEVVVYVIRHKGLN